MIPKIIYYCWFGRGEKPELAKKCIASWRKFCPDFEIREWNEDNCEYLAMPFMAEAYAAKKYAFVSDVMRLIVLEQYGGVYFDTDVEVVQNISPLMDDEGFIGFENDQYVASGLTIAAIEHHPIIQAMIDEYKKLHYEQPDGNVTPVGCPHLSSDVMERFGLVRNGQEQVVAGIHVYPEDYFNPMDSTTGKLTRTENTYSIHWYSMSWFPKSTQIRVKIGRIIRGFYMETKEYAYIRVSSRDQNEDRQRIAMIEYGIAPGNIYVDKQSGKDFERPGYRKLLRKLKSGDTIVMKSIDRLGRNYNEILEQWRLLTKQKQVDIIVLDMPLLNTKQGKDLTGIVIADIVLQLLSYVAQTEREFNRQRQAEGIAAAKSRGVQFGRRRIERPEIYAKIKKAWKAGELTARQAAEALGVSRTTFFKWIRVDDL